MSEHTKTVIVSGTTGLIGSQVLMHFSRRQWRVITAGRAGGSDLHFDLDDPASFGRVALSAGADLFVHAAASNEIECREQPYRSDARNILGVKAALEFCVYNHIPQFCYISTFHVFGEPSGTIDEKVAPTPIDDYGASHLAAEVFVHTYARSYPWLHAYVVRPSNVYGLPFSLNGFRRWSLVQYGFCREAVVKGSITLRSSGSQLRNFVAAEDLCDTVEYMMNENARSVSTIHVGGPDTLSIRELAEKIQEYVRTQTGRQVNIAFGCEDSVASQFQFRSLIDPAVVPVPGRHIDGFLVAFCKELLRCVQGQGGIG